MQVALVIAAAVALVLYLRSKQPGTSDMTQQGGPTITRKTSQRASPTPTTIPTSPPRTPTQEKDAKRAPDLAARPAPPMVSPLDPMSGPADPTDQLFGLQATAPAKPIPGMASVLEQLEAKVAPAAGSSTLNKLAN
jgi:hypothetical protein